ncbi:diacylglycerol kinase (ATP) [Litorivivens lipolytica]|uniref:Diacylglycerol kinase (ATP) n=1 Tax=Litorivivens lipolytica TaxID=1524264 RepID=A0A7W4W4N9_9GAMM|nr:diacylglycerol kinase (ATP) [Litorivivens lipolytica]
MSTHSHENSPSRFSVRARLRSFVFAWQGLMTLLREQHNARIHLLALVGVVGLSIWLGLSAQEWALVLLASALVMGFEALNSAVEYLCDRVEPQHDPLIRKAKDVAAAAVLIAALVAAIIALIIYLPKLLAFL